MCPRARPAARPARLPSAPRSSTAAGATTGSASESDSSASESDSSRAASAFVPSWDARGNGSDRVPHASFTSFLATPRSSSAVSFLPTNCADATRRRSTAAANSASSSPTAILRPGSAAASDATLGTSSVTLRSKAPDMTPGAGGALDDFRAPPDITLDAAPLLRSSRSAASLKPAVGWSRAAPRDAACPGRGPAADPASASRRNKVAAFFSSSVPSSPSFDPVGLEKLWRSESTAEEHAVGCFKSTSRIDLAATSRPCSAPAGVAAAESAPLPEPSVTSSPTSALTASSDSLTSSTIPPNTRS